MKNSRRVLRNTTISALVQISLNVTVTSKSNSERNHTYTQVRIHTRKKALHRSPYLGQRYLFYVVHRQALLIYKMLFRILINGLFRLII